MAVTRGALHMKKHDRRKRALKAGTEPACMRCRRAFWSDGPHHRMCGLCRRLGDGTEAAPGYVGPSVGMAVGVAVGMAGKNGRGW